MTSTQRSILTTFNRLLLAIFAMSIPGQAAQAQSDAETAAAADDQLGSTMTLDQLKARKPRRRRTEPDQPLTVEPAAEPVPALSIRLYPARWELRPGRAELHFTRAMMFFMENPEEARRKWQSNEWLSGTGDGVKPTREDLQAVVDGLKPLYDEVHALALSEDFTWDHRIRDIRGPEVYMYMLPDVQQVRTLARMLVLKVRYQLMNKDFDGALA